MITFVLPIAYDKDYNIAFNILLPSFFYFYKGKYSFIIIYKSLDFDLLSFYKKKYNYNFSNFKFVNEDSLISEKIKNTYYLQMYLKLKIYEIIKTKYYITLDSDVIFTSFSNETLMIYNNKPILKVLNFIDNWTKRVNQLLSIKLINTTNQTPFIFITQLVEELFKNLNVKQLILKSQCSEYTLYYGFLTKKKYLDKYFFINGINNSINYNHIKNKINLKKTLLEISKINKLIILQSRLNKHYLLGNEIKLIVPTSTFISYKIAVVTFIDNETFYKKYKNSINIKKNYCKYHNYEFYIVKNLTHKSNYLYKLFQKKRFNYIFISSIDTTIINKEKTIEQIIRANYKHNTSIYLTKNLNLNFNNLIWVNNKYTVDFLEKYKLTKNIDDVINYHLDKNKIKVIPYIELNSYFNKINRLPILKPNQFLINFREGGVLVSKKTVNYFENMYLTRKEGCDNNMIK